MSNGNELEVLIRARYPLIYMVSYEEERALEDIAAVASKVQKRLYTWSITRGLSEFGKKRQTSEEQTDPISVVRTIMQSTEPALYVLLDYHAYIHDAMAIRALRDAVFTLVNTQKSVIILSPIFKLPLELQKEVAVVDFPLPTTEQISAILKRVEKSVEGKITALANGERESLVKACQGLSEFEIQNALAKSVVKEKKFDIDTIIKEKEQIIRKSGVLEFYSAVEDMSNVGGITSLKTWLSHRQKAFTEKAAKYGLPAPKGVLMVGVQGCGKSLTAKAVPGLWKLPLLRLDAGRLFTREVGGSEALIRDMIKFAENVAPCVLWVDEIEKGFAGVQSSSYSDAGTTARVFATLITWLQEKTAPVFVIATANNITQLPAELLRKGRFDEIFFVDLPSASEREEIFAIHIKKRGRDPKKFKLKTLAEVSDGFSGSEIEEAVISGMYSSFAEDREFTTKDIEEAITDTVPLSKTMHEDIMAIRKWAESRARMASSGMADERFESKNVIKKDRQIEV